MEARWSTRSGEGLCSKLPMTRFLNPFLPSNTPTLSLLPKYFLDDAFLLPRLASISRSFLIGLIILSLSPEEENKSPTSPQHRQHRRQPRRWYGRFAGRICRHHPRVSCAEIQGTLRGTIKSNVNISSVAGDYAIIAAGLMLFAFLLNVRWSPIT